MFQAGQQVVYGVHGVCRIIGTEDRVIDRKRMTYLVLQPLQQPDTRFYIPSHNQNALAKLRPLMDKDRLLALLSSQALQENQWIEDENRRKQYYRQMVADLDFEEMIKAIHTLRQQKLKLTQLGRKFHLCDENFLRDIQKLLRLEFSLVLEIPDNELDAYLQDLMKDI